MNLQSILVAVMIVLIIVIVLMCWRTIRHSSVARYIGPTSLYDRLGGVYSIAAVVNHFSDALVSNPIVGKDSANEKLRDWYKNQLTRLPGLKFMRTLWVCDKTGGPYTFVPTVSTMCPFTAALKTAHGSLQISSVEFDEVAAELSRTLDHFEVPDVEKKELLAVFASHKNEVIVH